MTDHMWVEITYVPLVVEGDPTSVNGYKVLIDQSAADTARGEAKRACWHCHVPLDIETFGTRCEGADPTLTSELG